jgi:hypothetical protein
MRYPSVKTLLGRLATRGPSASRLEALRLLGLPDLPEKLPKTPRKPKINRIGLLKRLACAKRKSAKTCLMALKELLWGISINSQLELENDSK